MKQEDDIVFGIYDLWLATVLLANGCKLEMIDKEIHGKVQFIFMRDKNLEEIVRAYWAKELRLEPQFLFAHQKLLKNRIYSAE